MANALRELLASFGVQVDTKPLDAANVKVDSLASSLSGLAGKLAGVFAVRAIAGFVGDTIESTAKLNDMSQQLGISTQDLQRFQYAAGLKGAEDGAKSLGLFQKNIGAASTGNAEAAETFRALGVNVRDANGQIVPTLDLLNGVADGLQNLKTDGERTATVMKLFGRAGGSLLPLLKQGKGGLAKLSAEFDKLGGGISGETVKAMSDADDALDRLKFSGRALSADLIGALAPALTTLVGWITQGVGAFRQFAQNSDSVTHALEILGVIGAAVAIVFAAANIGIILAIAAVALIVLVFEDLWKTVEGGDTVTRRLIDGIFGIGATQDVIDTVKAAFWGTWGVIKGMWTDVVALGTAIEDAFTTAYFDRFLPRLQATVDAIKEATALAGKFVDPSKFFTEPSSTPTTVPSGGGSGGPVAVSNQIEVNNTFTGNADPGKVRDATRDGIGQGTADLTNAYAAVPGGG